MFGWPASTKRTVLTVFLLPTTPGAAVATDAEAMSTESDSGPGEERDAESAEGRRLEEVGIVPPVEEFLGEEEFFQER